MLIPEFVAGKIQRVEDGFLVFNMSDIDIIKNDAVRSRERFHASNEKASVVETRRSSVSIKVG
jgi:hypothetical protein